MTYEFEIDILQGGVGIDKKTIVVDLTDTELILLVLGHLEEDTIIKATMESIIRQKAKPAIDEVVKLYHYPGPKISGYLNLNHELPDKLIMDATFNPLYDAVEYFLKNAKGMDNQMFYCGLEEYKASYRKQ